MQRQVRAFLIAAAGLLAAQLATAGGPLGVRTNGQPYVWSTTGEIQYRTDGGPLSGTVTEAQARARVARPAGGRESGRSRAGAPSTPVLLSPA